MRRGSLLALGLAAGLTAACGSTVRAPRTAPAAGAAAAWELPPAALGTQRLYRAAYGGPEGDGSFRATLRLAAADRFEIVVADRLGRGLYTLRVEGDGGWWLDHRRDAVCRDLSRLALPGLEDGPVEARALPPLLLGAIPAAGATPEGAAAGGELELRDGAGRRWSATLDGGAAASWTLWDGDGPLWWWRRDGRGGVLSGREGRQLRWQEAVVEPLAALPPQAPPADLPEDCTPSPPG